MYICHYGTDNFHTWKIQVVIYEWLGVSIYYTQIVSQMNCNSCLSLENSLDKKLAVPNVSVCQVLGTKIIHKNCSGLSPSHGHQLAI